MCSLWFGDNEKESKGMIKSEKKLCKIILQYPCFIMSKRDLPYLPQSN